MIKQYFGLIMDTGNICIFHFVLGLIILDRVCAIPPERLQQAGPCVGMDCLHGVLMHGDEHQGDSHTDEDVYNKLQEMDEQNKAKIENLGPCKGGDCLHELMHDGKTASEGIVHMEQKNIGPQQKAEDGPCEGMDCLHGVLMHADKEPGKIHEVEDEKLRQTEENKEQDGPCIDCVEGRAHKHLPLDIVTPSNDETERQDKPLAEDPDSFLHTSGNGVHKDEEEALELLFEDWGVESPDKFLHEEGFDHNEEELEMQKSAKAVSGTLNPDSFLHSESDVHENHPKSLLRKVVSGTYDPHELLHGGDTHVHDKKKSTEQQQREAIERHEHRDIQRLREKTVETEEDIEDIRGFSLPFISDTIVDEIAQMKAKYMEDMWDSENEMELHDTDETDEDSGEELEIEEDVEIEELVEELVEAGLKFAAEIVEEFETKSNTDKADQSNHHIKLDNSNKDEKFTRHTVNKNDGQDDETGEIPRIVKITDNHEHPNPYSSNYRTGRDTAL